MSQNVHNHIDPKQIEDTQNLPLNHLQSHMQSQPQVLKQKMNKMPTKLSNHHQSQMKFQDKTKMREVEPMEWYESTGKKKSTIGDTQWQVVGPILADWNCYLCKHRTSEEPIVKGYQGSNRQNNQLKCSNGSTNGTINNFTNNNLNNISLPYQRIHLSCCMLVKELTVQYSTEHGFEVFHLDRLCFGVGECSVCSNYTHSQIKSLGITTGSSKPLAIKCEYPNCQGFIHLSCLINGNIYMRYNILALLQCYFLCEKHKGIGYSNDQLITVLELIQALKKQSNPKSIKKTTTTTTATATPAAVAVTTEMIDSIEKSNSKPILSIKEDDNTLTSSAISKFDTISTKTPETDDKLNSKLETIERNSQSIDGEKVTAFDGIQEQTLEKLENDTKQGEPATEMITDVKEDISQIKTQEPIDSHQHNDSPAKEIEKSKKRGRLSNKQKFEDLEKQAEQLEDLLDSWVDYSILEQSSLPRKQKFSEINDKEMMIERKKMPVVGQSSAYQMLFSGNIQKLIGNNGSLSSSIMIQKDNNKGQNGKNTVCLAENEQQIMPELQSKKASQQDKMMLLSNQDQQSQFASFQANSSTSGMTKQSVLKSDENQGIQDELEHYLDCGYPNFNDDKRNEAMDVWWQRIDSEYFSVPRNYKQIIKQILKEADSSTEFHEVPGCIGSVFQTSRITIEEMELFCQKSIVELSEMYMQAEKMNRVFGYQFKDEREGEGEAMDVDEDGVQGEDRQMGNNSNNNDGQEVKNEGIEEQGDIKEKQGSEDENKVKIFECEEKNQDKQEIKEDKNSDMLDIKEEEEEGKGIKNEDINGKSEEKTGDIDIEGEQKELVKVVDEVEEKQEDNEGSKLIEEMDESELKEGQQKLEQLGSDNKVDVDIELLKGQEEQEEEINTGDINSKIEGENNQEDKLDQEGNLENQQIVDQEHNQKSQNDEKEENINNKGDIEIEEKQEDLEGENDTQPKINDGCDSKIVKEDKEKENNNINNNNNDVSEINNIELITINVEKMEEEPEKLYSIFEKIQGQQEQDESTKRKFQEPKSYQLQQPHEINEESSGIVNLQQGKESANKNQKFNEKNPILSAQNNKSNFVITKKLKDLQDRQYSLKYYETSYISEPIALKLRNKLSVMFVSESGNGSLCLFDLSEELKQSQGKYHKQLNRVGSACSRSDYSYSFSAEDDNLMERLLRQLWKFQDIKEKQQDLWNNNNNIQTLEKRRKFAQPMVALPPLLSLEKSIDLNDKAIKYAVDDQLNLNSVSTEHTKQQQQQQQIDTTISNDEFLLSSIIFERQYCIAQKMLFTWQSNIQTQLSLDKDSKKLNEKSIGIWDVLKLGQTRKNIMHGYDQKEEYNTEVYFLRSDDEDDEDDNDNNNNSDNRNRKNKLKLKKKENEGIQRNKTTKNKNYLKKKNNNQKEEEQQQDKQISGKSKENNDVTTGIDAVMSQENNTKVEQDMKDQKINIEQSNEIKDNIQSETPVVQSQSVTAESEAKSKLRARKPKPITTNNPLNNAFVVGHKKKKLNPVSSQDETTKKKKKSKEQPQQQQLETDCMVCFSQRNNDNNPVVYCSECQHSFHKVCYGIEDVPEGKYFCDTCLAVSSLKPKDKAIKDQLAKDRFRCPLCIETDIPIKLIYSNKSPGPWHIDTTKVKPSQLTKKLNGYGELWLHPFCMFAFNIARFHHGTILLNSIEFPDFVKTLSNNNPSELKNPENIKKHLKNKVDDTKQFTQSILALQQKIQQTKLLIQQHSQVQKVENNIEETQEKQQLQQQQQQPINTLRRSKRTEVQGITTAYDQQQLQQSQQDQVNYQQQLQQKQLQQQQVILMQQELEQQLIQQEIYEKQLKERSQQIDCGGSDLDEKKIQGNVNHGHVIELFTRLKEIPEKEECSQLPEEISLSSQSLSEVDVFSQVYCKLCKQGIGATIKCQVDDCEAFFHPLCAFFCGLPCSAREERVSVGNEPEDENWALKFDLRCWRHINQKGGNNGRDSISQIEEEADQCVRQIFYRRFGVNYKKICAKYLYFKDFENDIAKDRRICAAFVTHPLLLVDCEENNGTKEGIEGGDLVMEAEKNCEILVTGLEDSKEKHGDKGKVDGFEGMQEENLIGQLKQTNKEKYKDQVEKMEEEEDDGEEEEDGEDEEEEEEEDDDDDIFEESEDDSKNQDNQELVVSKKYPERQLNKKVTKRAQTGGKSQGRGSNIERRQITRLQNSIQQE